MDAHKLAEERSLEFHREVARILERDASLRERVRPRVNRWVEDHSVPIYYCLSWSRLLHGPLADLHTALLEESEHARALRQYTPFAGVVDPRTRWRIWRETRQRLDAAK